MLMDRFRVSQRIACRLVGQPRATQRYEAVPRAGESALTHAILELANLYGRYGYRTVTGLLQQQGWAVQHGRVWRIWQAEGLKVPIKQKPRGRLFLNDGSCIRLRPQYKNHVWSYDFVSCQTHDGRKFRVLVILDEFSRECLALVVARNIKSMDVLEALSVLMIERGVPAYIRSDNGPEFVAQILRQWLAKVGVQTAYIEPGSPWENGYCESFNGKFRDQFLNGEIFYSLKEAVTLIERWRYHYNHVRPHSSLGFRPPAPLTKLPAYAGSFQLKPPTGAPPMHNP